jgi:predicted O-linked N-acetylglucosamine transferase (SPINDLY family)
VELADIARLRRAGRVDEAEAALRARLDGDAGDGAAWNELGHVLRARGDRVGAEAAFARAVAIAPRSLEPRVNLGLMLVERGTMDEARAQFEAALDLAPDEPVVLSNLSATLRQAGELERAIELVQRALARRPDAAAAHVNLGLALADRGDVAEALPFFERAVTLAPGRLDFHDSLLLQLHYVPVPRARIVEAHRRYGAQAAAQLAPLPPLPRDRTTTQLRVGLVSPDLRRHSVAYFLEPILRHHDREGLTMIAYSDSAVEDEMSARLRASTAAWHRVRALSDAALAERVRADSIDVLIDLAGHTAGHRLGVFARRPAPLQLSYLGYPDETGLDTIDARIGDAFSDPEDDARVLRMESGFLCYSPPPEAPPIAPLPSNARTMTPVPTLACFNAPNKWSDATLDLWARILAGAPSAQLVLKPSRPTDGSVERRVRERLASRGVAGERVTVLPFIADARAHLAAYSAVDVAIDTFPYHGVTTTCDALWMGVPVVTLAGDAHVSRTGRSLLARAGLDDLVAATADDYVRIALMLLDDDARRRTLRATLRARLDGLTDGARAAASFAEVVRRAWTTAPRDTAR